MVVHTPIQQPAPVRDELRPPPPPQRSTPDVDGQNAKRGSYSNSDEGRGRGIEAVEEQLEIEEDK